MKSHQRLLLPVLVLWVFGFFLLHQHFRKVMDNFGFNAIDSHLVMLAPEPAGEIVKGFQLEAQLASLDSKVGQAYAKWPVCVGLQMATYGDRVNQGSFLLILQTKDKSQSRDIQASSVEDNKIRVECFDQMHYQDLEMSPGVLIIKGVDGVPGSAVTAWLSNANGAAKTTINGQPHQAGLIYALGRFLDASGERLAVWILLATGSLIGAIILVVGLSRDLDEGR